MSAFWDRVNSIKAQQTAIQNAKIDSAIAKSTDFWNRVDAIKTQQASSSGSYPSAHEMIVNSGYDPSMVAFTQSSGYDVGKSIANEGISIDGSDLTRPVARPSSGSGSGSGDPGGYSASSLGSAIVTPSTLDYLNAEIAKHYGMSAETAYQEALSNTSYQRAVKDMQAAGLSPSAIFGAGKGSAADGVYSVKLAPYAGSGGGSGGSGGSRGSSKGSSKSNGKLFTTGQYYGISAAAGVATALISGNVGSYWVGQTVAQGIMTAANSFLRK